MSPSRLLPALLGAGLMCAFGTARAGSISGHIVDGSTQQPIALEDYPFVVLYQCADPGDQFCNGFTNAAEADAAGLYSMSTDDVPTGNYQLVTGASDYGYDYSAQFTLTAGQDQTSDITLKPLPIAFSAVSPCKTVDAEGWCLSHYSITNRSDATVVGQLWAQVNGHTNMPATDTGYSSGNGSFYPNKFELAPGASMQRTHSIYLGKDRDSGSYSLVSLWASLAGQPNETIGFSDLGKLTVSAGGVSQSLMSPAAREKALNRKTATPALQSGRASRSGPGWVLFGTLTAADTGSPLPTSNSPRIRLVGCSQADDAYCSGSSGEWVYLGDTGEYRLNTKAIVAGRYQIDAQARSGYGITRSLAFDAPTTYSQRVDLVLPQPILSFANVSGCETLYSSTHQCMLSFDVTNTTQQHQSLSLWVQVNVYTSGSPNGVSVYTAGTPGSMLQQWVRIDAGQTLHLQQPVSFSRNLKSGAELEMRAYVGAAQDPAYADAYYSFGNYSVLPDPSAAQR